MVSANSLEVPAPAEVKAMSTPLKSSLCCKSLTSICLPRKVYLVPALRFDPNNTNSSNGKFLSSSTRRNSCPTAPLAPTIATFIFFSCFFMWFVECQFKPQIYNILCFHGYMLPRFLCFSLQKVLAPFIRAGRCGVDVFGREHASLAVSSRIRPGERARGWPGLQK